MKFKDFRNKLNETLGLIDHSLFYKEGKQYKVEITSDLRCRINGFQSEIVFSSIKEAKDYAVTQIMNCDLIENVSIISESKVADIIAKYNSNTKITDTQIKEYFEQFNSNKFTLDPIITEMKTIARKFPNQFDYILDDGTYIVISEQMLEKITSNYSNKYSIVEFMQQSKDNFAEIIKEA